MKTLAWRAKADGLSSGLILVSVFQLAWITAELEDNF